MKHLLTIIGIMVGAAAFAASPAATQDWVRYYVATSGVAVSTNAQGNASWSQGEGEDAVTVTVEMPTAFCMVATNCDAVASAQGITNGTVLVYHRPLAVFAAPNARVWVDVDLTNKVYQYVTTGANAMTSTVCEAQTWLATDATNRHARIYTTSITPTRANAITNGIVFGGN